MRSRMRWCESRRLENVEKCVYAHPLGSVGLSAAKSDPVEPPTH